MQDSSSSPPNAGDTQGIVFSPTRPSDQQEKVSRRGRNKRRKDKASKSEQDNVNEDKATSKSNNDISDPDSVPNTPRGTKVNTVHLLGDNNSPPSSMEDDDMPVASRFNAWDITRTPQEEIEFSRREPNTPTLNNVSIPEDSTTPEEPPIRHTEPLGPVLLEMVYQYQPFARGSKFQGRLQNTTNQILNTATQWVSNLKARSEMQDRNASTTTFPDSSKAEDTGGNQSPYDEPSPAILILNLVDQALRKVGMSYPLFMHAKIEVTKYLLCSSTLEWQPMKV
jgi:hypothetical protein